LIASDRNIRVDHNRISIRISSSSWFKFPIWTTRWEETSPPPPHFGHDRATVCNGQEVPYDFES
jgi:hypothetical protein